MNISQTATALRAQLIKEISGFVSLFGTPIDLDNKQEVDAVKTVLFPQDSRTIDLEKSFNSLYAALKTNGLKRLVADNENKAEDLMFFEHTWSQCNDVLLDDLIRIHTRFEAHLADTLHRSA